MTCRNTMKLHPVVFSFLCVAVLSQLLPAQHIPERVLYRRTNTEFLLPDNDFDVLLNGKPVLRDFDIMKESGQPDYAVWKEFELEIAKDLTVALTSKTGTGSVDRMPLISAVQVLRIE